MAYEQKPGDFTLNKNEFKTEDKHPDYTGHGLDLNGNPVKVAAWLKSGPKGKFMSCRLSVPRAEPAKKEQYADPVSDGDIPF